MGIQTGNERNVTAEREPHAGSLRYRDNDGEWQMANPHDALYSSVTMCAIEYWDGEWKSIYGDDDGES